MYQVLENSSYPSERTQTERRWSNFKQSKMAVNRTNNMGGATLPSCIRSYQTPVTPVRGHGRERGRVILSHLSKMAVNRTNNMGAATLPSYIQSYQTPVSPVRRHCRKGGGAILSRVRWLSTEQTNNMGPAALPSYIRSYQTPVTPVRGHGGEGGGDTFQLIVTVQQMLCLIPFGPFFHCRCYL